MEKKAKQFDRIVAEWKQKVDSLGLDLDGSQRPAMLPLNCSELSQLMRSLSFIA